MQRSGAIALLGIAVFTFGLVKADAQGTTKPAIAFVDLQKTMLETNAGKSAQKTFETAKNSKAAEVEKQKKAFESEVANLDKQRMLLSADKLKERQAALERKYAELGQLVAKMDRDLAVEQMKMMQDVFAKAKPAIEAVAKAEGFTVVLDGSAVLWAGGGADITAKVNARVK